MINAVKEQTMAAVAEVCEKAGLKSGDILVIGCSTSEVMGEKIGSASNIDAAQAIFDGILEAVKGKGIYTAFQCCEHLNRAVVVSADAVFNQERVNVVPQPKAGGSLGTIAYKSLENAIVVEEIKADAGIDIGNTLIGMHLKRVAVPLRISVKEIGCAPVVCARTRPKFIGGERAVYDDDIK